MSIDLSLDRIRDLLTHVGPYRRPTCHIAGTNGKGSVTAILSSIFGSARFSVGRFNSPHLVHVHDCVSVNNTTVSRQTYESTYTEVSRINDLHGCRASSFELLTVTALQIFEHEQVDVVVLEVGMGGRLDATNVIPDDCVLVSALTSVDLDHQAFLGDTVEKITKEKAAIARKDKPFIIGPQAHPEVVTTAQTIVEGVGGVLIQAKPAIILEAEGLVSAPAWNFTNLPSAHTVQVHLTDLGSFKVGFSLYGTHQLDNLGTAVAIVDALRTNLKLDPRWREQLTTQAITSGISEVNWPGRLSFHTYRVKGRKSLHILADGAHNAASALTLSSYVSQLVHASLSEEPARPLHLVYVLALSHSPPKTPEQVLGPLLHVGPLPKGSNVRMSVAALRFTPPEGMPWVKATPPEDIRRVVSTLYPGFKLVSMSDDEASGPTALAEVLRGISESTQSDGSQTLVVVAGSLYLVADLYRVLGS
jgi:folylpolyglutamate synthase/dihydrofolate synthase